SLVMSEEGRRWRPSLFFHPIGWRLRSAVAEAGAATVVDPQAVAAVPPIAAFDAGGLGQLLDQHRAACTTVPGAGAHPVVFAAAGVVVVAAGDGGVVYLTLPVASALAACFGELGATAVVDPHRAIAAAPVPARDALGLGQLPYQRGAPPAGVADALAVVVALAAGRDGDSAPVAVRIGIIFGELGETAVLVRHRAIAA